MSKIDNIEFLKHNYDCGKYEYSPEDISKIISTVNEIIRYIKQSENKIEKVLKIELLYGEDVLYQEIKYENIDVYSEKIVVQTKNERIEFPKSVVLSYKLVDRETA